MKKKTWYKKRGYIHFDPPVSKKHALSIVTNPKKVAKHSFYPLLNFDIKSFKIFKDVNGVIQKDPKTRLIAYASHLDSHIYSYYAYKLSKVYEKILREYDLDKCVLAFRSLGKSNIDFALEAFNEIKSRDNCAAVCLDVRKFFDTLNHEVLKQNWCKILDVERLKNDEYAIFKSITKFSKVNKDVVYEIFGVSKSKPKIDRQRICSPKEFREKIRDQGLVNVNQKDFGIPQGSPISALLSNIYMLDFDVAAKKLMDSQGGKYFRYCDDILFITNNEDRYEIEDFSDQEIKKLKLEINRKKTESHNFFTNKGQLKSNKPLQYLGFTFDGQRILIRSAALSRFSHKMKKGVKLAKKSCAKKNYDKRLRGQETRALYKRKIYEKYSYLGRRNFITYGYRASRSMESKAIRKQLKPLWDRLRKEINE